MEKFIKKLSLYILLLITVNFIFYLYIINFNKSKTWKDYAKKDKIDIIFTGSSHNAFSINPRIIDSITNLTSFNISSPAQSPKTAFFLVSEIIATKKPKIIIQELFFQTFQPDNQFLNEVILFPELKKSRKVLWLHHLSFKEKLKSLFPVYCFKKNIKTNFITRDKEKQDTTIFYYNGYYGFNEVINESELNKSIIKYKDFNKHLLNYPNEQIEYLIKTVELCKAKNVQVIWYSASMPETIISNISNYQDFYSKLKCLSNNLEIVYFDFNQKALRECLNLKDNLHFKDSDHLNIKGGTILSEELGKILLKKSYDEGK